MNELKKSEDDTQNSLAMVDELASLRDCIRWGVSRFNNANLSFTQGMPNALDEAAYLCLHALHLPPDFSGEYFDCLLTRGERLSILESFHKRLEHIPSAYITHEAWFFGLSFYVDERVLIPRSPIAELIAQHFQPWLEPESVNRILDLCTGSGCIAIACAYAFEEAEVVASDLSPDALDVAKINRHEHGLESRLQLIESNLFESIGEQTFDIIVSNPPYISTTEMNTLATELEREPAMALAAGEDGMDLVITMLKQARQYLNDQGILIIEVGYSRPALEQRLPDVSFYWLDFEYGGEGVFLLTAEQLDSYQPMFEAL